MSHPICIFEDDRASQLHPLALTRPVFDLRCGISLIREKITRQFPDSDVLLHCRDYLKDVVQQENPGSPVNTVDSEVCLFINGRLVMDAEIAKTLRSSEKRFYTHDGQLVAALLEGSDIKKFVQSLAKGSDLKQFTDIERVEVERARFVQYPWDLVNANAEEIERDFRDFDQGGVINGTVSGEAVLVEQKNIHVGYGSMIKPGAVLDAEEGPIFVGENVTVMHNAVIEGPAFVGSGSIIKVGAKIYEGTSIGDVCKVGGEVEESIIHSYSNKQHDGFLGHAYLGQWVNLGADTNNSDLKNNYGNVKVFIDGELIDTDSQFVGLFMGDHSKSGINTMFNTGATVGTMCNVFGGGFAPKYIPSFSWGGSEGLVEHDLQKALATARGVMRRRKKELTSEYEEIFKRLFVNSKEHRRDYYH